MKKQFTLFLLVTILPIYLFSQINIVKIKFNEGFYTAPNHNAKLSFTAFIKNTDNIQHTNLQLNVKNLQTNQVFTSPVKAFLSANDSSFLTTDSIAVNYNTFNSYKFWVKYDINSTVYFTDTLKIGGTNSNQSFLSIDNNNYIEKYFEIPIDTGGIIGGIIANKFIFKNFTKCPYGIAVALNSGTTVGSTIKAILYKKQGNDFNIIAESDYYSVLINDINTDSSTNPHLTILPFYNTINCLYKDSAYLAGIAYFGGIDTVLIAEDNSNFYQPDSSVWTFSNNTNSFTPKINNKNSPIIKIIFSYGLGCSYNNFFSLSSSYIVLNGNQGSMQYVDINSCNDIINIVNQPWLSCYILGNTIVVKSLTANYSGFPRIDTVKIYHSSGVASVIVKQLADVSVNENETADFKIYPNPADKTLKLELKTHQKLSSVSIFSSIGKEMMKWNVDLADKKELELDISDLAKGIYIIEIQYGEKSVFKKLIKK